MADQIQIVHPPSAKELDRHNEYLFRFTSVFPLQIFPDEVILDKLKISIIKREFIGNRRIITLPLTSTVNVRVNTGIITSIIEIRDPSVRELPIRVKNVNNSDALQFHRLVEGIVIGIRQGVNFMDMSRSEMLNNATKWGSVEFDAI